MESLIQSISKISAMTLWHKVKIKLKYVVQFLSLNIPRVRVLELTGSLLHLYLKINIISDLEKANYYGECLPKNYKSKKEGAERIVMSINTGVHQTTEQIFDTVCHAESLKVSKSTNTALRPITECDIRHSQLAE